MTFANNNLQSMNNDILRMIYDEVTNQNRDEINIFKLQYNKFIDSKSYCDKDFSYISCESDEEMYSYIQEIEEWINNYILQLNQSQMNSIICSYGIQKALILLCNYHKIAMARTSQDTINTIMNIQSENDMVRLILHDAINFQIIWKD